MYVERSLQRGYKHDDIGISQTKAFRIKLSNKIKEFRERILKDEKFKAFRNLGKKSGVNNLITEMF